jgi:uncharacterized protein
LGKNWNGVAAIMPADAVSSNQRHSQFPSRKRIEMKPNQLEGLNRIDFVSCQSKLVGNFYCPPSFTSDGRYSAIVAAGPLGTVKEQAAGVFADKLARKGFITLAFDFRTQGESEGNPPNYENPFNKSEDLQNAVSYLRSMDCVDPERVGVVGICAGGSYCVHAAVSDRRIKALATVNGYLSLREFVGYNPAMTDEVRAALLNRSNEDRQNFFETGITDNSDILMPDVGSAEELPIPVSDDDKRDIFTSIP